MSFVSNLKVIAAKCQQQPPMIVQRRTNLTDRLLDQLEMARAESEGRKYLKARRQHVKNPVTGEYMKTVVSR